MMPYVLMVLAFVADRLTKLWVAANLVDQPPLVVNRWLTLQATYNRGVAFGLFQGIGPLVGWLTIGVLIGMFVYLLRVPRHEWLVRYGLALIIGGALGNMLDRVIAGQVLDFVVIPLRVGVFNMGDVAINVGMVLLLIGGFVYR